VTTSLDEALWVLRAQSGDREALERLLRSIQPPLLRYVRGLVGADDADDVLQDVLILIYRKLRWLRNPELVRPWAFRIASRGSFRHLRKKRRVPTSSGEELLESLPADDSPSPADAVSLLSNLDDISPASRAVLVLHFQEEMTLTEVAAVLEIPLGTVRSRLAYGLTVLRKRLSNKKEE
jgi:RNA polymerase sigma-70 factor (ECF subfamily)